MPFIIRKSGDQWCCYTRGEDGEPKGDAHGCHPTEAQAKRQLAALYANVPEARKEGGPLPMRDYMITFGAAVKAMGNGRVGGYLVQYGSEATKDAENEWFTADTDFDTEFPTRASIYYNHGLDPVIGRRRLGHGALKQDDLGVWVEAELDLADKYQAAMYRMAERGNLGWSSGSLSHITDPPRESPGGPIKSWPLGHDASLTPMPADRRNLAVALKSWEPPPLEELLGVSGSGSQSDLPPSLAEDLDRTAEYVERVRTRCAGIKAGTHQFTASRRERIARLRDELSALLEETEPQDRTPTPAPGPGEGDPREAAPQQTAEPLPDMHDIFATVLAREGNGLALLGGA